MGKGKRSSPETQGAVDVEPLEAAIAGAKLGVALLLGLVASAGALLDAFRGAMPVADAAQRFLVAFLLARLGIAVVWSLYSGYRDAGRTGEQLPERRPTVGLAPDAVNETR